MKLTVQLLLLVLLAVRSQGFGVTLEVEPAAGPPLTLKATVPSGGVLVPLAMSVTVTVHIAGLFAGVASGQSTVVEVVRATTSIVSTPVLAA